MRASRSFPVLVLLVVALAACASPSPSASVALPTGALSAVPTVSAVPSESLALISAAAAEEAAVAQSGPGVTLVSARLSKYGAEAGGGLVVAADTPVWAVLLSGSFPFSCGPYAPAPHSCPPPATTELVLIDARTGAFIEGEVPAPSPF